MTKNSLTIQRMQFNEWASSYRDDVTRTADASERSKISHHIAAATHLCQLTDATIESLTMIEKSWQMLRSFGKTQRTRQIYIAINKNKYIQIK